MIIYITNIIYGKTPRIPINYLRLKYPVIILEESLNALYYTKNYEG